MEQILLCMYNAHHERGKRRMRERATEKENASSTIGLYRHQRLLSNEL